MPVLIGAASYEDSGNQGVAFVLDLTERKRAEEALREEQERLRQLESELARMNRLSMMGELAASLAHEVTQPIAAARNNARAALNFLDKQPPDLGEVREALGCIVAMPIEPGTSSTGSATTSRKRLRERIVLISMRRSMK